GRPPQAPRGRDVDLALGGAERIEHRYGDELSVLLEPDGLRVPSKEDVQPLLAPAEHFVRLLVAHAAHGNSLFCSTSATAIRRLLMNSTSASSWSNSALVGALPAAFCAWSRSRMRSSGARSSIRTACCPFEPLAREPSRISSFSIR